MLMVCIVSLVVCLGLKFCRLFLVMNCQFLMLRYRSCLRHCFAWRGNMVFNLVCVYVLGLHQQLVNEADERWQDIDTVRDRLASASTELSQSSNHIAALEGTIEAERAAHIQTKFSCELLQVS